MLKTIRLGGRHKTEVHHLPTHPVNLCDHPWQLHARFLASTIPGLPYLEPNTVPRPYRDYSCPGRRRWDACCMADTVVEVVHDNPPEGHGCTFHGCAS